MKPEPWGDEISGGFVGLVEPGADGDVAVSGFVFSDDEHVGDVVHFGAADFGAELIALGIDRGADGVGL